MANSGKLPLAVNPGGAGINGAFKADLLVRKQWAGFQDSPQTTFLGIGGEFRFLGGFHGLAASVTYDAIGALTSIDLVADYSYHIELARGVMGLGMRLGAINVAFKPSGLKTSVEGMEDDYHQESDEAIKGEDDSATKLDIGVGGFVQTQDSYVGLSFLHLTAPKCELKSGTQLRRRPLADAAFGKVLNRGGAVTWESRFNFMTDFRSLQIDFSETACFRQFIGVTMGYRLQDAIIIGFSCNLSNGLYVGYDYEVCVNKFRREQGGSHEVALAYTFNVDIEKRDKRYKSVRIL